MTLLADVNCPGSQEDVFSNWQPTQSLLEDMVSGASIAAAPCLPALAVANLPFCLRGGKALNGSRFALRFFFFFLVILLFGLLCHISSLIQPSPYPKDQQSDDAGLDSLSSPYSLLVDAKRLGHFSAGSCS